MGGEREQLKQVDRRWILHPGEGRTTPSFGGPYAEAQAVELAQDYLGAYAEVLAGYRLHGVQVLAPTHVVVEVHEGDRVYYRLTPVEAVQEEPGAPAPAPRDDPPDLQVSLGDAFVLGALVEIGARLLRALEVARETLEPGYLEHLLQGCYPLAVTAVRDRAGDEPDHRRRTP